MANYRRKDGFEARQWFPPGHAQHDPSMVAPDRFVPEPETDEQTKKREKRGEPRKMLNQHVPGDLYGSPTIHGQPIDRWFLHRERGEVAVLQPGDWVVKADGTWLVFSAQAFAERFEPVG